MMLSRSVLSVVSVLTAAIGCISLKAAHAEASSPCEPEWLPSGLPDTIGVGGTIEAFEVFFGQVYAGGFDLGVRNDPRPNLLRTAGSSWINASGGVQYSKYGVPASVTALEVYEGTLYVAGSFDLAGPLPIHASNLASFDGTQWRPAGDPDGQIKSLVTIVNPMTDGPELIMLASGSFTQLDGIDFGEEGIAAFDGTSWHPFPAPGLIAPVLMSADPFGIGNHDGRLFAFQEFPSGNVSRVKEFQGGKWIPLGPSSGQEPGGLAEGIITDIVSIDHDGTGPQPDTIYVAGSDLFGDKSTQLARYDPQSNLWIGVPLPLCPPNYPIAMATYWEPGSPTPVLYISTFDEFFRFDGTNAVQVADIELLNGIRTLRVLPDPARFGQPKLFLGGEFRVEDFMDDDILNIDLRNAAVYDGGAFEPVPAPDAASEPFILPIGVQATAMTQYRDAGTRGLVIATEGQPSSPHAPFQLWNGQTFTPFPDDGNPPPSFIGGAGGAVHIRALYLDSTPDPNNPTLYVAGDFDAINGVVMHGLAQWTRAGGWQPLMPISTGVPGVPAGYVNAFAEYQGRLVAGGLFQSIGGQAHNNIAAWSGPGGGWLNLDTGVDGEVLTMAEFDSDGDGIGPRDLYVGGSFTSIGGKPVAGIAKFNSSDDFWESLSPQLIQGTMGTPIVRALHVYEEDGKGGPYPVLAVGGDFRDPFESSGLDNLLKWTGFGWELIPALNNLEVPVSAVSRVGSLDPDGPGLRPQQLYVIDTNGFRGICSAPCDETIVPLADPCCLVTIDDDGPGGIRGESIILANVETDEIAMGAISNYRGLARLAQPQPGLVTSLTGTLTSGANYNCGILPGPGDPVVTDYEGDAPDGIPEVGFYFLDNDAEFWSLNVKNGSVIINLAGYDLTLNAPSTGEDELAVPGIVVGGPSGAPADLDLVLSSRRGGGPLSTVRAEGVLVGPPDATSSSFLNVTGEFLGLLVDKVEIGKSSGGSTMWIRSGALLDQETGLGCCGTSMEIGTDGVPGAFGSLQITDPGTTWRMPSYVSLGGAGFGRISMINGANAQRNFPNTPPFFIDSGGSLIVQNGSSITGMGELYIDGNAFVIVEDASITSADDVYIGSLGSGGFMWLDSPAPQVCFSGGSIYVGADTGEASLLVLNEAVLGVGQNNQVVIDRGGLLSGGGRIDFDSFKVSDEVLNRGLVRPGFISSSRVLRIDGNFRQLSAAENDGFPGRTLIEIAGSTPGSFTGLSVSNLATLGGNLDIEFAGGYQPVPGELATGLPLIQASSLQGRFEVVNFPGLAPDPTGAGRFLRVEYVNSADQRGPSGVRLIEETLTETIETSDTPAGFTLSDEGARTAAALGDVNGDTFLDLVVTIPDDADAGANPGSIVVLYNRGSIGGFWQGFSAGRQITVGRNPSSVGLADFDSDGDNDIVVTHLSDDTISVLRNPGDGLFLPPLPGDIFPTGEDPGALVVSDFDGGLAAGPDSAPDVAFTNRGEESVRVLINLGGIGPSWMGFGPPRIIGGVTEADDITDTDQDNDKFDDIATTNPQGMSIGLIPNGGSLARSERGQFGEPIFIPVPGRPVDLTNGDLNLDGNDDLVVALENTNLIAVLLGNGTLTPDAPLTIPAGFGPTSVALADLDADGDLDMSVITSNGQGQRVVRIIRNDLFGGQLGFTFQQDLVASAPPAILLSGDITGDGNDDLLTVNEGGGVAARPARGDPEQGDDVTVFTFSVCRGDADNNRRVDMKDIMISLSNWDQDYSPGTGPGDANGDRVVNFVDITAALASFGRSCQ